MCNGFWSDFFANFLSDILVGGLLGAFLTWWIGKRISESDRIKQRKDKEKAVLGKTIHYLDLLQNELSPLIKRLPALVAGAEKIHTGIGMNEVELCISTPVWDILKPSGELPKLPLNPRLLALLAQFYEYLDFAKQGISRYLSKENPQTSDKQSFQVTIQHGFTKAFEIGKTLSDELDVEAKSLRSQLSKC